MHTTAAASHRARRSGRVQPGQHEIRRRGLRKEEGEREHHLVTEMVQSGLEKLQTKRGYMPEQKRGYIPKQKLG